MTKFKSYAEFKDDVKSALTEPMTLPEIYKKLYVGIGKRPPLRLYGSLRTALILMVDEGFIGKNKIKKYYLMDLKG